MRTASLAIQEERQGFAEVFRGGHDIEDDLRIARIGACRLTQNRFICSGGYPKTTPCGGFP